MLISAFKSCPIIGLTIHPPGAGVVTKVSFILCTYCNEENDHILLIRPHPFIINIKMVITLLVRHEFCFIFVSYQFPLRWVRFTFLLPFASLFAFRLIFTEITKDILPSVLHWRGFSIGNIYHNMSIKSRGASDLILPLESDYLYQCESPCNFTRQLQSFLWCSASWLHNAQIYCYQTQLDNSTNLFCTAQGEIGIYRMTRSRSRLYPYNVCRQRSTRHRREQPFIIPPLPVPWLLSLLLIWITTCFVYLSPLDFGVASL